MRPLLPTLALAVASIAATLCGQASQEAARHVSEEQIRGWLRDLDADVFTVRETATEKLIEAGAAAVGPVTAAVSGGSLEVATRGIHILNMLALSRDFETQEMARQALEHVAAGRVTAAARRANAALAMLDDIRQDRAILELRRLGAKIERLRGPVGLRPMEELLHTELGEKWRGGEDDLRRLSWLRDDQSIRLSGQQVKDSWLEHVGAMKNLAKLTIARASISDAAFSHLRNLGNLQELDLKYTPVGDGAAAHIQALKSVSVIKLYGVAMSEEGVEKLKAALPDATVDHRKGAFLGVGCQQHLLGCEIVQVQAGSAASKAGLAPGDVILQYNGEKTPDFQTLTKLISAHGSGATVTLEILRGGESLAKKITLGEWD